MTYKLFLDDVRQPSDVTWVDLRHGDNESWVVVRSYEEFVATIEQRGAPHMVSFDHDLQDLEHAAGMDYVERDGNMCAQWLVEYCRDRNILRPRFTVHSMNPVGRQRIWATMTGP